MIRALAESARVSNLPTVWTNALVGFTIAASSGPPAAALPVPSFSLTIAVVSLLYVGGMFLNDAVDADWDRAHKADRPIARGVISRRAVLIAALACFLSAVGLTVWHAPDHAPTHVFLASLVAAIVLYDLLHKVTGMAVVLMGFCRGLTYLLAAALAAAPLGGTLLDAVLAVYPASIAIVVYVCVLTLAARREDIAGARLGRAWPWLMTLPVVGIAVQSVADRPLTALLAPLPALAWLVWCATLAGRGRIPAAVGGWLAGICLFDAAIFLLLHRPLLASTAFVCWLLTLFLQRSIAGT